MTREENTLTFLMYFSTSSTFLRDIYRHPEARYLKCSEDGTLLLSTLKCIKRKLENVSPRLNTKEYYTIQYKNTITLYLTLYDFHLLNEKKFDAPSTIN